MTSISDDIASTILVLHYEIRKMIFPSQPISDICKEINDQIEAFELGFRFLAFLVDCNHKLSDAEFVGPHLAIKIQATIRKIVKQVEGEEVRNFRKEIMDILYGWTIFLSSTDFQKWASRILDVFTNLNAEIDLLKPEIREACKHLSAQPFQPHHPIRDLDDWRKLMESIHRVLGEVRHDHISVILQNLSHLRRFLDGISEKPRAEHIIIHATNVSIRTALVSCQWWATQFDPNMEEDVSGALLDLRRKIEFIDPESLDLILKQLKSVREICLDYHTGVELFVKDLLPFRRRLEEFTGNCFKSNEHLPPFTLIKELEYLTYFVLGLTKNTNNNQLLEFKLLISEIEESFSSYSLENLLLNFLAQSCLMKTEVCLLAIPTGRDSLFLPAVDLQINVLKEGLQQIKELPQKRFDNVNQILVILEEADNLEASLIQSCHANDITTDMDIRHMKVQVTKAQEKKASDVKVHNLPHTSRHLVSKTSNPRIDGNLLTLNDQQEVIIDRLIGGCEQQEIVSIVGMPGVGKTTLAKNVYSSPAVVCHFHVRAWCCVTEVYRKRELLLEILSQIILLTDKIRGMSNEDLEFKLRQLVLKKRYLIVMDDIWNIGAWDDLRSSFPEDDNGSRILITSRLNHVALKASARSDPHHLRLLSDAESWDLLQMKIFNEERCPEEFIEVGQAIAKNCKGLPLAIVTMAGILKRTDRQANGWKEIARNLSSRIIVDDPEEQCRDILELSYKLLPDYLQACFLYFGAFLEDQEIPVRKLIQLWIAEGFVQKTDLKSLEDLAEDYLEDLIGRNLVLFAQPRSSVGTKRCRVHDMLRNLCQSKAKEDNFLQVITRSNESDASFDDLDFVLDVNFSNSSNYKTYGDHRLCFYSKRNYFVESKPSDPYVRSLLFFATNDKYARSSYDISFISHNFILLKVLDLECINMGPSFPSGIELMVQLRYLGVSGDVDSVPSSIANLWNLETFVVKGLKGKVNLPDAIWCLKKLRHVHVSDIAVINLQDDKLGNSSLLECLVTLSSPFLPNKEETNNILRKFPNLRKLGCIFSKSPNCSGTYDLFPRLDVLTRLESLKICYYGGALHTAKFVFPLSLKKLTLSNFRLPWSHISVIGRLQNLEVLKLLSKAYDGERWDMVEGEFQNLRFLKLDSLNIAQWNASSDNLPKLEQLVLRNCKLLQEVPSTFVELCTLQVIEVQWCGKSVEKSVRRMREEADEHLKVIITSELESRSSV